MDRYASGQKQAVLKAVQWPKKSPVGSNPTLSFYPTISCEKIRYNS